VGHIRGINIVKIDEVLERMDEPPLVINGFKIHQIDHQLDYSNQVKLKPFQNSFSVDFVALNYRKQDDNQYAYYLEGFEEQWNYIGSKHVAYYTNLNPGKYTLHMKAGDAFGNWNEETLQLKIEVLPTFFQTAWFKVLVSLFITGVLYAFYRYRINQLLHLQQVRNRISADLHDELGSTLSGISIMGSLAKKGLADQRTSGALVDRIMEDVRQISGSLDDIVWNISPKNDSLASLIARMTRYASELFEAKQIIFNFDIPEQLGDIKLSMEQRRNIYLIFKEAVNNLAKYSKCSHASVSIRFDKKNVSLIVKDDGVGFDPNAPTDRNGLRNLKERAHNLKGCIDIDSSIGQGTSIMLEFPVI
jgi:two-component sensor histidine kinase